MGNIEDDDSGEEGYEEAVLEEQVYVNLSFAASRQDITEQKVSNLAVYS